MDQMFKFDFAVNKFNRFIKNLKKKNIKFMISSEGKMNIVIVDVKITSYIDDNNLHKMGVFIIYYNGNKYIDYEILDKPFSDILDEFINGYKYAPTNDIKIYSGSNINLKLLQRNR